MADRVIAVRLRAEIADFKRQMDEAAKATAKLPAEGKKAETALGRMVQSATANRAAWDTAGTALAGFGAATAAGLGLAAKAAMDWESAWTGVTKTVNGSTAELDALEADLRELARTLPATHQEIAAVAEAAGQLGVATGDITEFTKVMIDLGETTNLTADEAATSIAQLMNVMQTAGSDVDNLGSALVELGNNGASTERDIVFMAQRIAGAGKIIGLTEGEVLGFANALASVGIEVEAGGTAISKIMTDMAKAVSTGSEDLGKFAQVAGMTAQEFAAAFQSDPAAAIASFVEGLGRINAAGGDVFTTLDDLGQSEVRVTRALLTMANSGDLLRDSLTLGNQAWEENSALVAEAAKRYETTEAKIQIAKNGINDAAITIGEAFLPMIADAAEGVASFAEAIGNLPTPLLEAGAGLGAVAAAAGLASGAFLLLFPRAVETVTAFKTLQSTAPATAAALGTVGKALGVLAFAAVAVQIGEFIGASSIAQVEAAALAEDMQALADGAAAAGPAISDLFTQGADWSPFRNEVETTQEAVDAFASSAREAMSDDFWERLDRRLDIGGSEMAAFREQTEQMDRAFAAMAEGGQVDKAAAAFETFTKAAEEQGVPLDALTEMFPLYAAAAEAGAAAQEEVEDATVGVTNALQEQIPTLEELIELQRDVAGVALSQRDAQRQFEDSLDGVNEAIEAQIADLAAQYVAAGMGEQAARARAEAEVEVANKLDITTEAGRRNQAALDDVADSGWDLIESMQANGATQEDLQGTMANTRQRFIEAAGAMGMSSDEANRLADELNLIPENVSVNVTTTAAEAAAQIEALRERYAGKSIGTVWMEIAARDNLSRGVAAAGARYTAQAIAAGGRAEGGPIFGYSPHAKADNIPIWATAGEFMQQKAAVDFWGVGVMDAMNRMDVASVRAAITAKPMAGYATGGLIGTKAPEFAPASGGIEVVGMKNYGTIVRQDPGAEARLIATRLSDALNTHGITR